MRAALRPDHQAVVVGDDEAACFRGIDGARGIEAVSSIRRSLWMERGRRLRGRRP